MKHPSNAEFTRHFNACFTFRQSWSTVDDAVSGKPSLPTDIRLQAGCLYKLSGMNGSGKSTLLQLIAGVLAPGQSELTSEADASAVDRRAIFYVPHKTGLRQDWTAWQNLDHWCVLNNLQVKHHLHSLQQQIDLYRLSDHMSLPVARLSAGQRQKIALMRLALVTDRPLWLLDEPEAHLDHASADLLGTQITAHASRGGRVVWASHQKNLSLPHQEITL